MVAATRFDTLDGLRGIAVMGILLMNIAAFGLPEAAYLNPAVFGADGRADYAVWAIEAVLVDGRMRSLFSLLFGASMLLVIERADAEERDGTAIHFARMRWLLLFGLAHFVLLWPGDILAHYALVGMVAWFFAASDTRTLLRWGGLLLIGNLLLNLGLAALLARAPPPGFLDSDAAELARELALYRGGYPEIVRANLAELGDVPALLTVVGGETLGLMLLGMAGLRSGFLTGAWPRRRYLRIALACYAIGLPLAIAVVLRTVSSGYDGVTAFTASVSYGAVPRIVVMTGHAALALWWLTGAAGPLKRRVIAAGRVAFTNYLGTSLVMMLLFQGWGLDLFGRLDRVALLMVVAAAWIAMLAWSAPWLARFRYGPFEWLWRSLARGERQPFVRTRI